MLVPSQAGSCLDQQGPYRGLAHIERLTSQVVAAQLDQVEDVQEDLAIVASIANPIKHRETVIVAGDCLAVDDARPGAQVRHRLDNQGKRSVKSLPGRL